MFEKSIALMKGVNKRNVKKLHWMFKMETIILKFAI
jgi:hypothetical protein